MTRDNAKREIIEIFSNKPFSEIKLGDINTIIDKIYDDFEKYTKGGFDKNYILEKAGIVHGSSLSTLDDFKKI